VIAFARRNADTWVVAAVPRRPSVLADVGVPPIGAEIWNETALALPDGAPLQFTNVLTGETIASTDSGLPIAEAMATLPLTLLVSTRP
jgi:(1->4)-alpha-D-glucan 1-alpha-D-glucosylmutase